MGDMDESIPWKLLEEAGRLGEVFQKARPQISERMVEVVELVREAEFQSANSRTKAIFTEIMEKHARIAAREIEFSDDVAGLIRGSGYEDYVERVRKLMELTARVDPAKIADEELLTQLARARKTVFDAPGLTAMQIASVMIPRFAQMAYFADAVNALLGYPAAFRQVLDVAGALVGALAEDIAGTMIPFLGVLRAVFELAETRIQKATEEIVGATKQIDRIFRYGDELDSILVYEVFCEESLAVVVRSSEIVRESVTRDDAWLSEALARAARD